MIWAFDVVRVATCSSYVVRMSVGQIVGSFAFELLIVAVTMSQAGVVYTERRPRRVG